ncbi:lmo0954 family membrane protein [Exiguobacterium acetylicum]
MKQSKGKQVVMILAGLALLAVVIGTLPHMIGLGLGALLAFYSISKFMQSKKWSAKLGFGFIAAIGIGLALSNIWAVIGIVAAIALYVGYMRMKLQRVDVQNLFARRRTSTTHFEADWKDLDEKRF